MYLTDLLGVYEGAHNPEITNVTQDSRAVRAGSLFVAIKGVKSDGHDFVATAIENGAAAVVVAQGFDVADAVDCAVVHVENTRAALSMAAAHFYPAQPVHIVAITGTNGKTSVAHFVRQLWTAQGCKAASLGTLGVHGDGVDVAGKLTTPDTVGLHKTLSDLAGKGIDHLAMEASSHGIEQHRLDGVKLRAAGFTNLSRDHLDYHGDMDRYFAAKARLFTEILPADGAAVVNADTEYGQKLMAQCKAHGIRVISYGHEGTDIKVDYITPTHDGQDIHITVSGQRHHLKLPLVGGFQVMNALCALGLCLADDGDVRVERWLAALVGLQGAPGRLQLVEGHPYGAVYVDYAHTPDALDNVLRALRSHVDGKLYCIVGCGGDRDAGKRPIMGRIANDLADVAIITDDNPRSEAPAAIRTQMMEDAPEAREIGDRAEAIKWAINDMADGDILVIAGKGHEQGQIVGDEVLPFDDAAQAAKEIGLIGQREV